MSGNASTTVVKVTFKYERDHWRLTILQKPEGTKEPVLALRAKCPTFGEAMDAFTDWQKGMVIV
jgi:hypothetical protein